MKYQFTLLILTLSLSYNLIAQESAAEYMAAVNANYMQLSKDTWDYIKKATTANNVARIDKKRLELIQTLKETKYKVSKVSSYNGDNDLKEAVKNYIDMSIYTLTNDFKQIINLEKIAEESYDDMEAYFALKDVVKSKMDSAFTAVNNAESNFATKHNINLVNDDTRLASKIKSANEVSKYYNKIYLMFFKSYWSEQKLMDAFQTNNIEDMEYYRQYLENASKEASESLKEINAFRGDITLKEACAAMQEFYYGEALRYIPKQITFFKEKEKMDDEIKAFQAMSNKSRTQEDINAYNATIKKYNELSSSFNETNEYLNKFRKKRIENWLEASDRFHKKHI